MIAGDGTMVRGAGILVFPMVAAMVACSSQGGSPLILIGDSSVVTDSPVTSPDAGIDRVDAAAAADAADVADVADAADLDPATPDDHDALPEVSGADVGAAPIWTDASTTIDVTCRGFHEGQMRFRARRDQLSGAQLALLAQVRTAQLSPPDACTPDVLSCTIAITTGGGETSNYLTFNFDQLCGTHDNLVANATFRPFTATLPCRYGFEGGPGTPSPPALLPDERCFHGLPRASFVPDPVLSVVEAGVTRHIEADGCVLPGSAGAVALQIFAGAATAPLVEGSPVAVPGDEQACARLDYVFTAAGDYRLHIGVVPDGGIPITSALTYFRFY
jgi:hypothetical protein